jgi:hypothetical protein
MEIECIKQSPEELLFEPSSAIFTVLLAIFAAKKPNYKSDPLVFYLGEGLLPKSSTLEHETTPKKQLSQCSKDL